MLDKWIRTLQRAVLSHDTLSVTHAWIHHANHARPLPITVRENSVYYATATL